MSEKNYVDFNTFLFENVFNGNIVTSNLNANANEFVPRIDPEPEVSSTNNYGNRRSKAVGNGNGSNNRCYNHNHRSNKRNDFWNKNRENASSNNTLHDKNQDSSKVIKSPRTKILTLSNNFSSRKWSKNLAPEMRNYHNVTNCSESWKRRSWSA